MYATIETATGHLAVALSEQPASGAWTVLHDVHGPATTPGAAVALYFDGPLDEAYRAAADFAYRERIGPLFQQAPGVVRSLVLFDPERRATVVVSVASDQAALDAVGEAVNSQELLPGEDEALLPGPDRVEPYPAVTVTGP